MPPPMLYSPPENTMSSLLSEIPALSVSNLLHLLGIVVAAILINRLLRLITKLIVKPAASQTRAAQAREQQTRTLAGVVYSGGSKVVWALALLMAAQEFGVNVTPVVAVAGTGQPGGRLWRAKPGARRHRRLLHHPGGPILGRRYHPGG